MNGGPAYPQNSGDTKKTLFNVCSERSSLLDDRCFVIDLSDGQTKASPPPKKDPLGLEDMPGLALPAANENE